jgi:hypothetical protein
MAIGDTRRVAKLRILYLAVGPHEALHAQARYAMLSALAWGDGEELIHLHTDSPERYQSLVELAPRRIAIERAEMTAPNSIFEFKLSIIQQTARQFHDDAILFCDADTFFTRPYADLSARILGGDLIMHRREYDVAAHPTPQMRKFRHALRNAGLAGATTDAAMWNSGVAGLPPGNAEIVENALRTFARLSPHTKKQYLAEQYSLSRSLASRGPITPAENWIFHYWYQKAEYTHAINQRMEQWSDKSLAQISAELQTSRIALLAPPQKLHWWEEALVRTGLRTRPPEIRGLP